MHRSASLLAVAFLAIHVLTAVIDPYAAVGWSRCSCRSSAPRGRSRSASARSPSRLVAALVVTSLLRRHLSRRPGRGSTGSAYAAWPLALVHGIGMGSDSRAIWLRTLAAAMLATIAIALGWRVQRELLRMLEHVLERSAQADGESTGQHRRVAEAGHLEPWRIGQAARPGAHAPEAAAGRR